MGWANCRFQYADSMHPCNVTGSREWHVYLADLNTLINVPEMWNHYMVDHLVQPNDEERRIVMAADPKQAVVELLGTRAVRPEVKVLYVEQLGQGTYTHEVGTTPDTAFVSKLEQILTNKAPLQTKGLDTRPGYR